MAYVFLFRVGFRLNFTQSVAESNFGEGCRADRR